MERAPTIEPQLDYKTPEVTDDLLDNAEAENQRATAPELSEKNDAHEVYADPWDNELYSLVAANQDVIVKCPWMDNAEVTLSIAMNNYPAAMTAEDEPLLIAIVHELLANRVEETEEPEEIEAEEEITVQEDEEKPPLQENKKMHVKEKKEPAKKSKTNISKKETHTSATTQQQPIQQVAEARPPEECPVDIEEPWLEVTPEAIDVDVVPSQAFDIESATREGETIFRMVEPEIEQQVASLEITKAEPITVMRPEAEAVQVIPEERHESLVQPVPIETTIESARIAQPILEVENLTISSEDILPPVQEVVETTETRSVIEESVQYSREIIMDRDLNEDEEAITTSFITAPTEIIHQDADVDESPIIELPDNPDFLEEARATDNEELIEVELPTEQIEESPLIQLVELIEDSDPQTIEMTYDYLDKIIEVAERARISVDESTANEAEVVQELEELFIELFDELDISYTSELIEDLAWQALKRRLVSSSKEHKNEEVDDTLQDNNLRSALKHSTPLPTTFMSIIARCHPIGRIALKLYTAYV